MTANGEVTTYHGESETLGNILAEYVKRTGVDACSFRMDTPDAPFLSIEVFLFFFYSFSWKAFMCFFLSLSISLSFCETNKQF